MCSIFRSLSTSATYSVKVKTLMIYVKPVFDKECALKVELKPLPSSLRYELLGPTSTYPVIVNASLSSSQVDYLLRILRLHPEAIGYTLDD